MQNNVIVCSPVDMKSRQALALRAGDVVRIHQKIVEKNKTRVQVFAGIVIACKHGIESGATFTVRRVGSDGIAVEKIFPLYSPMIDRIELTNRTKTRRSKLYFLRAMTQKQVRDKLRRTITTTETTVSELARNKETATVDTQDTITPNADETISPTDATNNTPSPSVEQVTTTESTDNNNTEKKENA